MLGLVSIPATIGPPLAGFVYDQTQSYGACFLAAGVSPIVSALLISFVYLVKGGNDHSSGQEEKHHSWRSDKNDSMFQNRPVFSISISNSGSDIRGISWRSLQL